MKTQKKKKHIRSVTSSPKTLSNSNRWPSRASLDSTCVGIEADISERASTIRELCEDHIPDHILRRVEEVGFVVPTDVQRKALPIMLSGRDCILHAQKLLRRRMFPLKIPSLFFQDRLSLFAAAVRDHRCFSLPL